MSDLLKEFLSETAESLAVVDSELAKLPQELNNTEILDRIFRLVHTIKGTCGYLDLPELETAAHAVETHLEKFRGENLVTREALKAVSASIAEFRLLVGNIGHNKIAQPHNIFAQLETIMHLVARDLGKSINLQVCGMFDPQTLKSIRNPLMHLLRNAADHGLETPQERLAGGKPGEGTVRLFAYRLRDELFVEVSDDGRGLDTARIRKKALAEGLAAESELKNMPDHEVHEFVFEPGFSTAENTTPLSGRGVGLDAVCADIRELGGTVEIKSVQGQGATFVIRLPLVAKAPCQLA